MCEVVQRGQQFPPRQVAAGAEDHERGRRDRQALQTGDERVLGLLLTGWAPRCDRHRQRPPRRRPALAAAAVGALRGAAFEPREAALPAAGFGVAPAGGRAGGRLGGAGGGASSEGGGPPLRGGGFAFAPAGAGLTAWPPNWLRRAASTRSAKSPFPRERKRAYSDAVITGVGTSWAVASAIVQRPSPESAVKPSIAPRSLPSASNARAASSHSHERTTEP